MFNLYSTEKALEDSIPIVKTLYNLNEINTHIKNGRTVLFRKIKKNNSLYTQRYVFRNRADGTLADSKGRIECAQYGRVTHYTEDEWEELFTYRFYHQYDPEMGAKAYAAYLLPEGISAGERVYIEDLIEHIMATEFWWPVAAADAFAVWNGKNLIIDETPFRSVLMVG